MRAVAPLIAFYVTLLPPPRGGAAFCPGLPPRVSPNLSRSAPLCARPESTASAAASTTDAVPARARRALVARAAELGLARGSYAATGWSNRLGSVLTPAALPGVYTADRPFYWNGIDVGGRMTVVQLGGDPANVELAVHSPVGLDPPLIEALAKLGRVAHVISPNYEHVKFARQWALQYPNANIWGCPGLAEREPDTPWTGEVPFGARPRGFHDDHGGSGAPEGMWDWEELQPLHMDIEVNPFTGRAFFNEVLFYHAPSKTLMTTDFYWNYPRGDGVTNGQLVDELAAKGMRATSEGGEGGLDGDFGTWELAPDVGEIPLGSKIWGKVGMDRLFYPFYMKFMVRKDQRKEFEEIGRFVSGSERRGWEVETIIPCHGDIVRGRELCRKVLEVHFAGGGSA